MKPSAILFLAIAGLAASAIAAIAAPQAAMPGHAAHAPAPKLSLEQAQAIALQARPGQVTDHEIEKEEGGSGVRYAFDIKSGAAIYEVGVDANTGQVLENSVEGADPD